ncbi:MAG: helix-turn-helix transcriptional regulator [Cytophagales bacterium]|nr:helix-turn-helix transcriptional regulator [Cytophagales bacterium]
MKNYSLKIKNLTCDNCMRVLKEQLEINNIHVNNIMTGKIILANKPGQFQLMRIRVILRNNNMQLILGRKQMIVAEIKGTINNLIFNSKINRNNSDYISGSIGMNYNYLSGLFKSVEKITIEKYIISQKRVRVKQLLIEGELTETKIAKKMRYSSVQYLSNQFKKTEGETLSSYKKKHSPTHTSSTL